MFRVGWVSTTNPKPIQPFIEAFVSELNALGYVQGQNIVYDIRYAENDPARLPVLIDELISLKPDVLVGARDDKQDVVHPHCHAEFG